MLMRSISLVFIVLSLTHCTRPQEMHVTSPTMISDSSPVRATEAFTRVLVNGNIDVILYTGDTKPRVILHGDPRNFSDVHTSVHNGLLQVHVGKGYPHFGRVQAEIRTHYLTSFVYHGSGKIMAGNLQSARLDLAINNSGDTALTGKIALRKLLVKGTGRTQISGITPNQKCQINLTGKSRVKLSGVLDVSSLTMSGNSWLSMNWIKSNVLKVRAKGKAFIQMAGIANTLDLALMDKARFNGRYLRSTNVFVKTFGHSVADICALETQHTLASDASNIFFHKLPEMKADFMAWNGSVLDMRDRDLPNSKEYTSYNR